MTQAQRVLRHLQDHGHITAREAIAEYGIIQLPARVHRLRNSGHRILSIQRYGINRYGETVRYVEYWLEPQAVAV
jgi:hypothetical protein